MEVPKHKARRIRSPEEKIFQQLENLLINERIKVITHEILSYTPPRGSNNYSYWNFYSPFGDRSTYGHSPKTWNPYFIWARTEEEALVFLEREANGFLDYILREYFISLIRGDVQVALKKGTTNYLLSGETILNAIFRENFLEDNLFILTYPDITIAKGEVSFDPGNPLLSSLWEKEERSRSTLKHWTVEPGDEDPSGLEGIFFLARTLSGALTLMSSLYKGDFISYLTGYSFPPEEDLVYFVKERYIVLSYRDIKLVEE